MLLATCACAAAVAASSSGAATSSTVVTAVVPSASTINTTGCGGNASSGGMLDLGTVLPGSPARSADCVVAFGSSNDTASLRVRQVDATAGAMYGQPTGSLDTSFGGNGLQTYDFGGAELSYGGSLQVDGKLVIGGLGGATDTYVIRVDAAGVLDPTFDGPSGTGNGIVSFDYSATNESAYRVEATTDGIYVPVRTIDNEAVRVLRLADDGDYDPGWGTNGVASVVIESGRIPLINAVDVLPGGGIVISGCVANAGSCAGAADIFIARFDAAGRPDSTFGGGDGVITRDLGTANETVGMLEVQPNGSIVAAAEIGTDLWVGRFLADGSLDTAGFNAPTGSIVLDHGGNESADVLAIRPDGRILVGGDALDAGQTKIGAFQLTAAGTLDTSFGTSGVFFHQPIGSTNSSAEDIKILPDGGFLLAGQYNGTFATSTDMLLVRVTEGGVLDTSFGVSGSLIAGEDALGLAYDIVDFPDGRIALVGNGSNDMQVAVLDAGPAIPDYGPGNDWATVGAPLFGVCLEGVVGGSTTWATDATCPMSDGAWRAVPTGTAGALAATTASAGTTGTATFAFGMRAASSTTAGEYVAPVRFEVVAPG
jgi:uncharacterized delta-60 repeat protein